MSINTLHKGDDDDYYYCYYSILKVQLLRVNYYDYMVNNLDVIDTRAVWMNDKQTN